MRYILCLILYSGLLWSCTNQSYQPNAYKLSIDSSMIIIMESTNLLNKSCLPTCWPRNFSNKKRLDRYTIYVWDSTYTDQVTPKFSIKDSRKPDAEYMMFDSVFRPLLDHLNHLKREKISIQELRPLSKPYVRMGLVKGLTGDLSDDVLGYFQLSPVVVNKSKDKGVFYYTLIGLYNKSWVVSVEKKSGKMADSKSIRFGYFLIGRLLLLIIKLF